MHEVKKLPDYSLSSNKAFRIVLIYFILSVIWIFFTDSLTFILFSDPKDQNLVSIIKGWLFIFVTAFLLYRMISKVLFQEKSIRDKLSEQQFYNRTLFQQSPTGLAITSIDGNYVDVNPAFAKIIGRTIAETLKINYWDITPKEYFIVEQQQIESLNHSGQYGPYEKEYIHKDGHLVPVRLNGIKIEREGKIYVLTSVVDITVPCKAREAILKANRVYNVTSHINQTIIRTRERSSLFEEVCKIAVEYGQFKMAWIGIYDYVNQTIKPSKWFGNEEGYLEIVQKIIAEQREAKINPVAAAIKDGHYFLCNDVENDRVLSKRNEDALARGYRSILVLPILVNKKVFGAFGIYASDPSFFNEEEIHLLNEMLSNIGFALEMIDTEENRKEIQEELVKSEQKFHIAFHNSPDAITIASLSDYRLIDVNESFLKMTGYEREEVIGHPVTKLKLWKDDSVTAEYVRVLQQNGRLTNYETEFWKKDGSISYATVSGELITLNNEPHVLVIVHDISNRKRTEQLLRKSEEMFRTVFESSPFALMSWDKEAKIQLWNTAAEKLFGWNKNEVIGKVFFDFFVPEYEITVVSGVFDKLINNIPCVSMVNENLCKDGKVILCEWANAIIHDLHGNMSSIISVAKDITEQVRLEREIKESREQMRALASYLQNVREEERVAIAREMHDELGQILSSIKMNLVLIQRQIAAKNHQEDSQKVYSELDSLNKLIDRAVMRVRKLITQLRPELLDKLGLIPALEWYADEFTKETKIACTFTSEYEEISLDKQIELTIFRTVQESLTNALKHASASKIEVRFFSDGDAVVVEIVDNGKGITHEEMEGSKSFGLLGMRERAKMVGGNISITGVQNQGTTIKLMINAKQTM